MPPEIPSPVSGDQLLGDLSIQIEAMEQLIDKVYTCYIDSITLLNAIADAPCAICGITIYTGNVTRPIQAYDEKTHSIKTHITWSHLDCVPPNDDRVPICKHWIRRGECMYQSICLFRHPDESRHEGESNRSNLDLRGRRGQRLRRRVFNEGRAGALRRWILNIFGDEYLRSGTGVIDVAGGKGELAFELRNLNDIPSCVFDPRPLMPLRYCRKLEFGYFHRNEVLQAYNPCPIPLTRSAIKIPLQIRGYFEVDLSSSNGHIAPETGVFQVNNDSVDDGNGDCEDSYVEIGDNSDISVVIDSYSNLSIKDLSSNNSQATLHKSQSDIFVYPKLLHSQKEFEYGLKNGQLTCWTQKGLTCNDKDYNYDDSNDLEINEKNCPVTVSSTTSATSSVVEPYPSVREVTELEEARHIIRNCSIVVGMHPDQAAEHILEFAIQNNKPCAFIPCCVYNKQFPRRRNPAGAHVRKYGEFIEYLLSKLQFCVACTGIGLCRLAQHNGPISAGISSTGVNEAFTIAEHSYPQFGVVEMDFEGKNLLVFYLGDRTPLIDPYNPQAHVAKGPATAAQWHALSDGHN